MTVQTADVLRIAAADADILSGEQPVKNRQVAFGSDLSRLYWKRPSDGALVPFFNGPELASQDASNPGAILLGMSGIEGVTPTGGGSGSGGTIKAMLEGIVAYINGSITPAPGKPQVLEYLGIFEWDIGAYYSQNQLCYKAPADSPGENVFISNIPGTDTNTGLNPYDNPEAWTLTSVAGLITTLFNTKANAS